jgi:hypothetical protein
MKTYISLLLIAVLVWACDSKPKVIEAVDATEETQQNATDPTASKLHKVVVDEVLQTSKYTYLHVTEDGAQSWIAIPKKEVKVGATYYYRGGLKKTNFKSVEYDRVFETLYLVSDVSEDPGLGTSGGSNPHVGMSTDEPQLEQTTKLDPPSGGISIVDLLKNRQKYDGQTVKVKGRCVKRNNMIMNRNWIHLQDGSMKDVDLTVTTTENVQLGSVVSFEGKIALNKDFGAGYKYEIIMEEAHLLP